MGVIIEDIRYLDKFRPSETDVDWSLYNIGEPFDIEIDYRVEEYSIAQSNNPDDFGWILASPKKEQSGQANNSGLILADNPNAFEFFFVWVKDTYDFVVPRQAISIPVMLGLSILIIKKGANLGVKALYVVVAVLFISLTLFFIGKPAFAEISNFTFLSAQFRNKENLYRFPRDRNVRGSTLRTLQGDCRL